MAPHSSTLAWKIPWMEEPGGPRSMGSLRVGHDWATSLSLFTFMHWRRKWQPTPVFLPGESQGRGSLVGCRLWGRTGSDTTDATEQQQEWHKGTVTHQLESAHTKTPFQDPETINRQARNLGSRSHYFLDVRVLISGPRVIDKNKVNKIITSK